MSTLELIVEDLKHLPPHKLVQAANYVHGLQEFSRAERMEALAATGGGLTTEEADELSRIIEEGCEKIEADDWK